MIKTSAATSTDTKRILRTAVTDALSALKKILQDPARNNSAKLSAEIDIIITKLNSAIETQIPAFDFSKPPVPVAKSDDGETKVPAYWRKNLDYGTNK